MIYGFFGGAFDPPHLSHTLACLWALETGEIEQILVAPCARHPFGKQPEASFEDRIEMCRIAFERLAPWIEIVDIEARRAGVSYTIDTLRALQEQRPCATWRLLIGSDNLEQSAKWKDWDALTQLAPPLVVPRMTGDCLEARGANPASTMDLRSLSSTFLRGQLAQGVSPTGLISAKVLEYIRARNLYR